MPASVKPGSGTGRWKRVARLAWLTLGLLLVGVGFVGMVIPLLPTVDFMLLALPCFAKSSPRLEAWLLDHPRFGPGLRGWRERRAIPRSAKIMASFGMAAGFAIFWLHIQPGWLVSCVIGSFLLFWAIWIARRPEPVAES